MKVLIDECAPKALKTFLSNQGHECLTVQEAGWSGKQNGELLNLADTVFDVLGTVDTNLRYQQNLSGHSVAIVVLVVPTNRLIDLSPLFSSRAAATENIHPGDTIVVGESVWRANLLRDRPNRFGSTQKTAAPVP